MTYFHEESATTLRQGGEAEAQRNILEFRSVYAYVSDQDRTHITVRGRFCPVRRGIQQ